MDTTLTLIGLRELALV